VLTGKYSRADLTATAADLASGDSARKGFNVALGAVTERSLAVADAVKEVAAELGRTPAQVGLAWTLHNPDVTAPIIGARTPAQLDDNLGALDVDLSADHLARLDAASAIPLGLPHDLLAGDHIRQVTRGTLKLTPRR
jgi:aryl-alcohol dehydrogenase-like predicted oxidoreductase